MRGNGYKIRAFAIIALFAFVLALSEIDLIFRIDPIQKQAENRTFAGFPQLPKSAREIREFTQKFDAYFNDYFGFRNSLIRFFNFFKVKWLGVTSSDQVALGKKGWLIWAGQGSLPFTRNLRPFGPEELQIWLETFQAHQTWLAKKGIDYAVTISPNPTTIYPEVLPSGVKIRPGQTRLDIIRSEANRILANPIYDLVPLLKTFKDRFILYFKTDTHWTDLGGLVGTQGLINGLRTRHPDLPELKYESFNVKMTKVPGGDLARIFGMGDFYAEVSPVVEAPQGIKIEKSEVQGQDFTTYNAKGYPWDVVIFRDSYAIAMEVPLSTYFRRVRYVWDNILPVEEIRKRNPQLVIWQMVERKLNGPPRGNPPEVESALKLGE